MVMGPRARRVIWILIIALLLAIHGALAWTAVRGKSATYDEPPTVAVSWQAWWRGDFRADYEQPPLPKYWVGMALPGNVHESQATKAGWQRIAETPMSKWNWAIGWLFFSGNPALAMIARGRAMMLVWAIALGAVIAWWAWRLRGPAAGIIATFFWAFDPNFLGHGALVKNDVAAALVIFAVSFALWAVGKKCTVGKVILLSILCGVAIGVKFSTLIIFPVVLVLLIARGIQRRQLLRMIGACVAIAVISYGTIWAMYQFRYSAAAEPGVRIDMKKIVELEALRSFYAIDPSHRPTDEQVARWNPGWIANTAIWAGRHRLLPEAFVAGLLWTGRTMQGEWTYLLGGVTFIAPWYYFPVAAAVKTPLATIVAVLAAGAWVLRRRFFQIFSSDFLWTAVCLGLPAVVIFAAAMASRTALGIRYIFPVYPFLFVLIGVAGASVWGRLDGKVLVVVLAAGLAVESLWAYPNYIAFFNLIAGGERGGIAWLGDSNLDWGQDLPLLARWEKKHPKEQIYLSYFGTADPQAYGVTYHNLPGGFPFGPKPSWPNGPCVMAISATNLQGIYDRSDPYAEYRNRRPIAVLGGSIYLFRYRGVAN